MLGRVFDVYQIEGLNQTRLIDTLKKKGINLYNVKKRSEKIITVWVKKQDFKKFFAITKELCYNVKKLKTTGLFAPVYFLITNLGVLLGAIIFAIIVNLSSTMIFSISFTGSGSVEKHNITQFLLEKDIKPFESFSKINYKNLSSEILKSNPSLTFVEVTKEGNRLVIYSVASKGDSLVLNQPVYELYSPVDGEIIQIKIYRGSGAVELNQKIKAGDLLVSGYTVIKEKPITVNVIAKITIKTSFEYVYISKNDKEEDLAVILAEENLKEKEIIDREVIKTFDGKSYQYIVKLYYKHIILTE